jgi:protein-L-isoaspartate(D-aspartate) O-methyltransferase
MNPDPDILRMLEASAPARTAMVREQLLGRGLADDRVIDVFRAMPREWFVPKDHLHHAYSDQALPVGPGQTLSQPYIVAYMTQQLRVADAHRVLEVGTGTGYQAAILGQLARAVDTIEADAELSRLARERLKRLPIENVRFHVGDGSAGFIAGGPYDRIIVTASCPRAPEPLLGQLADNGILIAPIGSTERQTLVRIHKRRGGYQEHWLIGCRFVRLIGAHGWPD